MPDDAPKSAFELAMERLRQKDRADGVVERPMTDAQRTRIAEIRAFYEAKLAELAILNRPSPVQAEDEEALALLEEKYRDERERLQAERERKIAEVHASDAAESGVR